MSDFFGNISANVEWRIGNYVILNNIGKGSFGEVRLARHIMTSTEVAVKIVSYEDSSEVSKEIYSLKQLNHPNITKLFEVINTNHHGYIFMEHACEGTLHEYIKKYGPLTEKKARAPFHQILSAVHYCHQKNIVHRDIKPENILLDMGLNIKLADFGLSEVFREKKLTTFCGTHPYMAPELFRLEPYEGPKVDVWSMGVVLYKMLTGVLPFVGKNLEQLTEYILSGSFFIPYSLSIPCRELLKKMINTDASRRPTLEVIMQDRWVNIGQSVVMTPYIEPPWTDLDPQVTQIMRTLGYEKEEIEDSLTGRKFNNIMGTYRILNMKMNIGSRRIKVRPCSSSDSNMRPYRAQGMWASGKKGRDPVTPPPTPESIVPTPPGSLEWNSSTSSSSTREKTTTPPGSMRVKTITPPGSMRVKTTTPPGSMREKTTTPPGSMREKTTTPPGSMRVKTTTPHTSMREKTTTPHASMREKTTTLHASMRGSTSSSPGGMQGSTPTSVESLEWSTATPPIRVQVQRAIVQPESPQLGKTSQPGSARGEKTSQPGSACGEKTSQPSSTHLERASQPGSACQERTSQQSSAHLERTSQAGSVRLETTSQPGSAYLEKTSQAGSVLLERTSQAGSVLLERTSQRGSRELRTGLPATQSSSSSRSCGRASEGRTNGNCRSGPSYEETSASSSVQSQGRKGVARRVLGFFLKFLCCPIGPRKQKIKITQVAPM